MSQEAKIAHVPSLIYTVLHLDYLVICDGDHCAAKILKLFEAWARDKDTAIEQARYHNASAKKEGLEPTQDESRWMYNYIPNIQRRLLFEHGEKAVAKALKLLEAKGFITSRNNPKYKWDKTKQYQFQIRAVQTAVYNITPEQLALYYIDSDPIKLESLDFLDTAKMRHRKTENAASVTKKCGINDEKVRDDPNSLQSSLQSLSQNEREIFEKFVREEWKKETTRAGQPGKEVVSVERFLAKESDFKNWYQRFLASFAGKAAKKEAIAIQYDWINDPRFEEWLPRAFEEGVAWAQENEAEREQRSAFLEWAQATDPYKGRLY